MLNGLWWDFCRWKFANRSRRLWWTGLHDAGEPDRIRRMRCLAADGAATWVAVPIEPFAENQNDGIENLAVFARLDFVLIFAKLFP